MGILRAPEKWERSVRKPEEVELTVSEVLKAADYPPPRKFWDYFPAQLVGLIRRFVRIAPTPRERWYIARGMRIMIELTQSRYEAMAESLVDKMLDAEPEEPENGYWN